MRRLLSHRDARLLLAGQTLSVFGDKAMLLALGVWVKTLTGSTAEAGLVFFVYAAPGLLAPLAGLLVDRARARPLMIATDCVAGLAVLSLLTVHGRGQVWLIYTVTLVYGCVGDRPLVGALGPAHPDAAGRPARVRERRAADAR